MIGGTGGGLVVGIGEGLIVGTGEDALAVEIEVTEVRKGVIAVLTLEIQKDGIGKGEFSEAYLSCFDGKPNFLLF